MQQLMLFPREVADENAPTVYYQADPDRVRRRLQKILDEAKAADVTPWDLSTTRLYLKIVPQMVCWLPADEAAKWKQEFLAEGERLFPRETQIALMMAIGYTRHAAEYEMDTK